MDWQLEEAQNVRAGLQILRRVQHAGTWRIGGGTEAEFYMQLEKHFSFTADYKPKTRKEGIASRSYDSTTVSKHHVHMSFGGPDFHSSGIRSFIHFTHMIAPHSP